MSSFDKSTRMNLPPEKMLPVVARTGFLVGTATKVWDNDSNLPASLSLLMVNTSGSSVTFKVWVSDDSEAPATADLVGCDVPLNPKETMRFPDQELWVPEHGSVWVSANTNDAVLAYLMGKIFV